MHWQYHPFLWPLVVAAAISIGLSLFAWRRRWAPGAVPFTLLMLAVAWWSVGYALELGSADLEAKVIWSNLNFLGIVTVPASWLAFAAQYTNRQNWLTRRNLTLLTIEPVILLLLIWTDGIHALFRTSMALDTSTGFVMLAPTYGVAFWVHAVYSYLLLLIGTILLFRAFIRSPEPYRGQAGVMLLGALVPWVGNALHIFRLTPFPHLDLTPFAFTLTGFVLAWGLFRYRLLDIVPVARRVVIESMDDGVIVLDLQNRVLDLNLAAARIMDREASDVFGQPIDEVLSARHSGVSQAEGLEVLAGRCTDVMQAQVEIIHHVDGEQRHFDLRISPLTRRQGGVGGRLVVLHDITERKSAEEALAVARDQALEASRLKSELLANVSHDLRTPLTAILGYADMLHSTVRGPLSDEQSRMIERVIANARQLSSLINDLLDQAQVEAGKLELERVLFTPASLIKDTMTAMSIQAQAKGLKLTSELADDVPTILSGDPQRLRQILVNLVGNAIKFTAQGAIHVRVYRPDTMHWALQVSDTGCGIPQEAQQRVFDPFWQMDGSPTREQNGVGLGLSLVRQFATLMGGVVELESKVGHGSMFTVILPLTLPQEEEPWKNHSR
jgi:PAS domain S-box-containing protein